MNYKRNIDDTMLYFERRNVAEDTLSAMRDILRKYGSVSVADVCDLIEHDTVYDDTLWGWRSLDQVRVTFKTDDRGELVYMIRLPLPTELAGRAEPCKDPMVTHPSHYQSKTGLEVIDVIEAFTADLNGLEATDTGNVLKYMCRWKKKNGVQDLKKAKWYLEHLIAHVNDNSNNEGELK